jgi:hypothetical protein
MKEKLIGIAAAALLGFTAAIVWSSGASATLVTENWQSWPIAASQSQH